MSDCLLPLKRDLAAVMVRVEKGKLAGLSRIFLVLNLIRIYFQTL